MQLPMLVLPFPFSVPTMQPLPLLPSPPKALTASNSNQTPATVLLRCAISANAIAACMLEWMNACTYVSQRKIQHCIKFFSLKLLLPVS